MLLLRIDGEIEPPIDHNAVMFRKILFSSIPDTNELFSIAEWEELNPQWVELLDDASLYRSCLIRDVIKTGSSQSLTQHLKTSLIKQKNSALERLKANLTETEQKLDLLGGVWSFGSNALGQLGHGNFDPCPRPKLIKSLRCENIVQVFAGFDSQVSFAINRKHDVFVWGNCMGPNGLSDHEEKVDISVPVKVDRLYEEAIDHIAVGRYHCCAKSKDGDVYTWGRNNHCQLGIEPIHEQSSEGCQRRGKDCLEPMLWEDSIPIDSIITQVSVGTNHTFAVSSTGNVFAYGALFDTYANANFRDCIAKLYVIEISCGALHAGLVTQAGQAYTWGSGDGGRLGHGDNVSHSVPKLVECMNNDIVLHIACAIWHSIALILIPPLKCAGAVCTWGTGRFGQLAQGETQYCAVPNMVKDLLITNVYVKRICAGSLHNAVLSIDNQVFTWGSNTNGCLGRPTELADLEESFCAVPGQVENLDRFVGTITSVACGKEYTLIATKAYDGLLQEELEARERERESERIALQRFIDLPDHEKAEMIRNHTLDQELKNFHVSHIGCTLCQACPGYVEDTHKLGHCQHCQHEMQVHTTSHSAIQSLKSLMHVVRQVASP